MEQTHRIFSERNYIVRFLFLFCLSELEPRKSTSHVALSTIRGFLDKIVNSLFAKTGWKSLLNRFNLSCRKLKHHISRLSFRIDRVNLFEVTGICHQIHLPLRDQ